MISCELFFGQKSVTLIMSYMAQCMHLQHKHISLSDSVFSAVRQAGECSDWADRLYHSSGCWGPSACGERDWEKGKTFTWQATVYG